MRRSAGKAPPGAEPPQPLELERRPARGSARSSAAQRRDLRPRPARSIVSRFERSISPGSSRPGGEHDRGHLEPGRPRRLDRQQGVVDRPEPGRGGDHHRQAEVAGEVADQVVRRQRDEEARRRPRRPAGRRPRAAACAARRAAAPGRSARRPARRRGAARPAARSGRARSRRRTAREPAARRSSSWSGSPGVVEPADRRLEDGDPLARAPRRCARSPPRPPSCRPRCRCR